MTVINPNSISGITSITLPAGADNVLTIHTNDGVERFRIDSSGNIKVGTAATISPDGDLFVTGVTTATTFTGAHSGSGANLTSLPAAQLTGALPAISGANLTGIAATDNVRTGILDVAGIATFRNDVNIGAAVTISESGIEASGIGITCASINGAQIGGRRNKIINGAMILNQRSHTGAVGHNAYGLDRWKYNRSASAEFNIEQSTESPDGFAKSLQVDCTTASGSVGASNYVRLRYHLEGQDLQDFAKGTSSAKEFALSFYAKSSVTGDYCIALEDGDNTRMVTATYTVSNTNWNRYTVTFPADTTGALDNDTDASLTIWWWFISGSNFQAGSAQTTWGAYAENALGKNHTANLGSSTSNNFYLTGVQLEVGSQATAFEHRSFGEELRLCQRYFFKYYGGGVNLNLNRSGGRRTANVYFPTTMRANPTITITNQFDDGGATIEAGTSDENHFSFIQGSSNASNDAPNVDQWEASAEL